MDKQARRAKRRYAAIVAARGTDKLAADLELARVALAELRTTRDSLVDDCNRLNRELAVSRADADAAQTGARTELDARLAEIQRLGGRLETAQRIARDATRRAAESHTAADAARGQLADAVARAERAERRLQRKFSDALAAPLNRAAFSGMQVGKAVTE